MWFYRKLCTSISPDAIEQAGMGYVYKVLITLKKTMDIGSRIVNITSGMTATADIKLEKRKRIDFFLPAIDYIIDSIKRR